LNIKPLQSFKTLETMHPPEQYHIPKVRNLQVSFICINAPCSLQCFIFWRRKRWQYTQI